MDRDSKENTLINEIDDVQFNCNNSYIVTAHRERPCGMACSIHWIQHSLVYSFLQNKILWYRGGGWRYGGSGSKLIFQKELFIFYRLSI